MNEPTLNTKWFTKKQNIYLIHKIQYFTGSKLVIPFHFSASVNFDVLSSMSENALKLNSMKYLLWV